MSTTLKYTEKKVKDKSYQKAKADAAEAARAKAKADAEAANKKKKMERIAQKKTFEGDPNYEAFKAHYENGGTTLQWKPESEKHFNEVKTAYHNWKEHIEREAADDDDTCLKFSDLPEDVQQKIVDAMSIHDVGTWGTISTSERQRVGGRMEHVLALTQPPFGLAKNQLCNITRVRLLGKEIGDEELCNLADACAKGALAKVTDLRIHHNSIGDAGISALADACAKGALANLQKLFLNENKIGDAGLTALADACSKGALAQVNALALDGNKIGDAGLAALADACAMGALAQVTTLDLGGNQIGDAGLSALADACAKGALASLKVILIDDGPLGVDHPKLKEACEKRGITLR